MKIFKDPNADAGSVITKYKTKVAPESAAFYAPYIPLNMEVQPPEISEESDGEYRFRLRGGFDCLLPKAERAWRWIEANIAPDRYHMWNGPRSAITGDSDLIVEFHDQKEAALFKLFFL